MLRPLALSATYLVLLLTLKIKILWGYKFLWPRIFLLTRPIIPESVGYLNPFFYFDDVFIAFLCFTIYLYLFKKNSKKINIFVYVLYLSICIYSILSSIILYKYGVPFSSAIIYQIDSLYTMRTSIDTELQENFRLIIASFSLLIFTIIFPIFLTYIYKLTTKKSKNVKMQKIMSSIIIPSLFLVILLKDSTKCKLSIKHSGWLFWI